MQNQHLYNLGLLPHNNQNLRNCSSAYAILPQEPYSSHGQLAKKTPNLRIGVPRIQKSNYHDALAKTDNQIMERYSELRECIQEVKNNINELKTTNKTLVTKIHSAEVEKKKLKELIKKIDLFLKSNNDDKKKVGIVV